MKPPSTFRSALFAYRKELLAAGVPPQSLAVRVIDRWSNHGAVESLWKTIAKKLPAEVLPTPKEFIGLVVQRRLLCEQLQEIVREAPALEAKTNARAKQNLREKKRKAVIVEQMALDNFVDHGTRLFGREKVTGPRNKVFMRGWSDKFRELCGDPLDEVVRVLTEVAFGGSISIASVRGTNRATTRTARKGRDTRPPK
jgi:hypothetical protein